jgi:hypothetical protein
LLGGALLATAMGLSGSLLGCATVGMAAASAKFAQKRGLVKDNPALRRFGQLIARDVQPYTNVLLRTYLRGSTPAINVLSLRRQFNRAAKK